MKNSSGFLRAGGLAAVIALSASAAEQGFYWKIDGGANFVDVADADVDTGIRAGLAPGYNFNRWLGAEFEFGLIYNTLTDNSWFAQMPFLANLVVRYENESRWTPYIGGGAGGALTWLNVDVLNESTSPGVAGSCRSPIRRE